MALTLAESAKLSTDMILAGVIETVIKEEHILDQLPFVEVVGNSFVYNRLNTEPTVSFLDVGDTWTEDTPDFTQLSVQLKILGGDADVDLVALEVELDVAVLRDVSLGDIHFGHDLYARDDSVLEVLGSGGHFVKDAVDTILDLEFFFERFDVNIAGAVADGPCKYEVYEVDHGGLAGDFAKMAELMWKAERGYTRQLLQYHAKIREQLDELPYAAGHGLSDDVFFLFENTNNQDHRIIWITALDRLVDDAFKLPRLATAAVRAGELIEPPFKQQSSICKRCYRRRVCIALQGGDDNEWQNVQTALTTLARPT